MAELVPLLVACVVLRLVLVVIRSYMSRARKDLVTCPLKHAGAIRVCFLCGNTNRVHKSVESVLVMAQLKFATPMDLAVKLFRMNPKFIHKTRRKDVSYHAKHNRRYSGR